MLFTSTYTTEKEENIFETMTDTITVEVNDEVQETVSQVSKYLNSLVCEQYEKSVEDIENTVIGGHSQKRKRTLQQVMRESFFYGANRFGTNFIA